MNFTLARLASDFKFTLANRKFHSPWREIWRVLFPPLTLFSNYFSGGRGGGRGRGGYDNRGGYNNRGRGGYDNHYSDRNQYNNSRDQYGGNDNSYNRDRNQYGNRGGYNHNQQRGGHYGGERNQGSGHYGGDRNRQGGNHENSGPSRTIYAGKMEDRQSHYPDRHRPYGNRPQRGRGGPPQQ